MDTRTKIVSTEEAARLSSAGGLVVSGSFDPLVAEHARQLAELKQSGRALIVAIAEPPNPILPARARAELVAGLAVVDFAVESAAGLPVEVNLEEAHERILSDLIRHVHARQSAAS